ncbi:uncharacterized protein PgNI_03862 [Pyricularia grisea]|uniref:Inhibitor of growth protein N-terminal histone-binding domain-containing protein n=1 Tax=Pyricularia grisea TaxID=148305 RepID=A0A6P8BAK1_PYRGI|nr:uncharacterized protein PgNI_03862 [Pyricularia grisea]TLD12712.1 hypothetical protein PgNI_03862 [Pyricularia grisea]
MPRDDLSIDFVKRMPQGESLDPSLILDDWINRVQNLPEEIRFIQDEILDKDRQYNDCIKIIEDRDSRIQKYIKAHGSHAENPKEASLRATIRENYAIADRIAGEKVALSERMKLIMDKHVRELDKQLKILTDRNEPGFTDPDELPSLLRPNANPPPSTSRVSLTVNTNIPHSQSQNSATTTATARAGNSSIRTAQTLHNSASAPATPAAGIILGRQAREVSAGPSGGVPKRGPRINGGAGSAATPTSNLARHSSLGPGTPKGHTATGLQRAGSAGPRASSKGAAAASSGRKGTPSSTGGRKKTPGASGGTTKSGLSRVKRVAKNSPSSNADSELSDDMSASGDEVRSRTGTPSAPTSVPSRKDGGGHGEGPASGATLLKKERHGSDDDEEMVDLEDEEAGDDRKYCLCQNVSFGNMVAYPNAAGGHDSCLATNLNKNKFPVEGASAEPHSMPIDGHANSQRTGGPDVVKALRHGAPPPPRSHSRFLETVTIELSNEAHSAT